mmetsp:Transcript_32813/g.75509  ORF Transcript_32813/g.75509 Transcript_32813/m.75509 type:complete len:124 (-) Transcript_32813:8-379(-)
MLCVSAAPFSLRLPPPPSPWLFTLKEVCTVSMHSIRIESRIPPPSFTLTPEPCLQRKAFSQTLYCGALFVSPPPYFFWYISEDDHDMVYSRGVGKPTRITLGRWTPDVLGAPGALMFRTPAGP